MPRPRRLYYTNAFYHVTVRANNGERMFADKQAYDKFLSTLAKYQKRFGFKLFAFVVMINHFHLVIQTSCDKTISKVMQAIILSLSWYFRRRYKRTGHIWETPFTSRVIESEKYLGTAIRYVENNPVKIGMVRRPNYYKWSSAYKRNRSIITISVPEL